ncbi:hypothetical protein K2F54_17855 [Cryobacterium sp. 1639]|uniref:hypothetical protein n=1 Tax=Cryobacterium inferilacus TaxID=2866629 RepID=UPI001C72E8E1|nr:hypothetical protein [Cryobacterium sp. 1639]MBX0301832.1 hypothetical protein [Cryobacterium sp. 1639]
MDERDSSWERDDPRFRIYVFEGAGNAVTTVDVIDGIIEQALESAIALSKGDEHLWALALVDDQATSSRGLIWLSGMDYNSTPSTVQQWRQRQQMQNRYLRAKHLRGLPPVLPNGLRLIRMFPEWVSGWPLWENHADVYRPTGTDLGLSRALSDALYAWNEVWLSRQEDEPEPVGWREQGQELFESLSRELHDIAEVRPEYLR